MGFDWPDIDWPDIDWRAWVEPKVIELMNRLGYPWPTTSPEELRAAKGEWQGLETTLRGYQTDIDNALTALSSRNEGQAIDAATASLQRDDSAHATLDALSRAMGPIAFAYGLAADAVVVLRVAVVAEILLDAIQLGMAIWSGGMSAGVSILLKQGAGAVLDYLIDEAIDTLMGA